MKRPAYSESRYAALSAVHQDHVRYHTGLSAPALGYTWSEELDGRMPDDAPEVLRELWTADLIEVDTHRLFAQRGHRVTTTINGYLLLCEWAGLDRLQAA